jgi:hypothetical protein
MIIADARSRFTSTDLDVVARALGDSAHGPSELNSRSLDEILDRSELRAFILSGSVSGPSPSLFFYILSRHALLDEGLDDRTVADYCAALLRDFGLRNRATQIDDVDDHVHGYMIDILNDLESSQGDRHFKVLVHLGNYALWLTGMFPDRIRSRRLRRGGPNIDYYETLGQRGFAEASEHRLAEWTGLDHVLHETADHFGEVRRALNRVRQDVKLAA